MKTTVRLPAGLLILGVAFIFMMLLNSFRLENKIDNFDVINAKRINIVENDGTIRMVISNKAMQHSGRMNGKDWEKRERPAGLIFFNDQGDESGGLIYQTKKTPNGNLISGMSITMDRYKDDQVLQLLNDETVLKDKIVSQRGLYINDFPSESDIDKRNKLMVEAEKITDEKIKDAKLEEIWNSQGSKNLLFIGKTRGNSQGLFIRDKTGKPKLMIFVDDKGEPKIQTINEKGETKDFLMKELK